MARESPLVYAEQSGRTRANAMKEMSGRGRRYLSALEQRGQEPEFFRDGFAQ